MSLPILLSTDAQSFWESPRREEREPFRASVMAEAHLRATVEGQPVEIYADPQDGWYGNTGGTLRAGVQTGASFGGNDVILRAGRLVDIDGNSPLFPFYATLGYDRRW